MLNGNQLVLGEPGVVVELAEIIASGIGPERNDEVIAGEALGISQGGANVGPAGAAEQDSFSSGNFSRGVKRFGIGHANPLIDHLAVERLRHVILADSLNFPRFAGPA